MAARRGITPAGHKTQHLRAFDCPSTLGQTRGEHAHEVVRHSGTLIAMATVTRTFLVDDLDGSTEDVENVRISLDGANFEIDLSAANAARLRENLARYV